MKSALVMVASLLCGMASSYMIQGTVESKDMVNKTLAFEDKGARNLDFSSTKVILNGG